MQIYLVRHGDAVPEEDAGSDRDRWLSARGREAARILGRLLREQNLEPDAIVCSPLPRAVQTAELIAATIDYLAPIVSLRALEPSAQPRIAATAIAALGLLGGRRRARAVDLVARRVPARPAVVPAVPTAQCCAIRTASPRSPRVVGIPRDLGEGVARPRAVVDQQHRAGGGWRPPATADAEAARPLLEVASPTARCC